MPAASARVDEKKQLRSTLRAARRDHVAALPAITRRLLFLRPPGPVAAMVPEGAIVGLYHAIPVEAPTRSYAKWFAENGRRIALPWFAAREAPMLFREWRDPYGDDGLVEGPWGALQPADDADELTPDTAFVPLLGFTAHGQRIGQGGGHYDRWLADHPQTQPLGMAWDCQLVESLPLEPHDRQLRAVITPTRLYEGSAA